MPKVTTKDGSFNCRVAFRGPGYLLAFRDASGPQNRLVSLDRVKRVTFRTVTMKSLGTFLAECDASEHEPLDGPASMADSGLVLT